MKDVENESRRTLFERCPYNLVDRPCSRINSVIIMVHKKKVKIRKKTDQVKYEQQPAVAFRLSRSGRIKTGKYITKHISMTEINKRIKLFKRCTRSSETIKKKSFFDSKFVVNRVSRQSINHFNQYLSPFNFPTQKKWKVYRCQVGRVEDSCCCSCNSDAMFEVMKGLYDCYKKKNCDNCNCILCSHLLREERRLGEERKSEASLSAKERKKAIIKKTEKMIEGKTHAEKEDILRELAKTGQPLPKGKTASEKALIKKVREEIGVSESTTTTMLKKMKKTKGIQVLTPSEKIKKAKAQGLITPLEGKTRQEKERIIRGLAMQGLPLPEGKTASEKKLIDKVRYDIGLPPEPKTASMREKYAQAADAGLLQPLEDKSQREKERILQGLHDRGIPLPEGRTASERALIAQVKAGVRAPSVTPSERIYKAKAAGLITPLEGKSREQQERILKGLAMHGLPLPEGKTSSERKLIDKVRADLGLPPEPKTAAMKEKYAKAADAGLLQPLEGKSHREKERILQGLHDRGIPLPEGRTASERALIAQVKAGVREPSVTPSEKIYKAKAAGLITPLEGKSQEQQERILKGLAMHGLPLPEGKTSSERKLIDKVRADLGLPPEPKTAAMKEKYAKAADAGLLQPLEGKSPREKERILQGLHDRGIPLPEGRTASERALIAQVKAGVRAPSVTPYERLRKAKAAGLITPLEGKSQKQQEKILKGLAMQGLPLPEGRTDSEKKLIDKVRADLGLPPEPRTPSMREKHVQAADAGLLQPLEGKSPREKEQILQGLHNRGIPLPDGRTASERALIAKVKAGERASERVRRAQAAGLLTPLEGKTRSQKEKIMRGLAMNGLPLPEAQTASEKKIMEKVRNDLGLPPEPTTAAMREKYEKAADAGFLQPLEDKSPKEKERILQGLHDRGIPLPEGRTASERALIAQVKAGVRAPSVTPYERLRKAKAAGLITPLEGKSQKQQEKILKGLAMQGLPLPEGRTDSEKKLIDKVRADLGLPPEPRTPSMREKHVQAADAGLLQPLEGKSPREKEQILQGLHNRGIPLPDGRTASERALIAKVKAGERASERVRRAQAAGLLTPLEGKTRSQKEKIMRGLAMNGLPLPEAQTASEKKIMEKVRNDLGLPPEPTTATMREKYEKAADAGFLQPLEGKSPKEKERILQGLHDKGIPLPEGRTASERALIAKIRMGPPPPSVSPTERVRKAKAAGLLTPLEGKSPRQQEKILKGLAMQGLPLPEGRTVSEEKLIDKVRADLGLPPKPKTASMRDKHAQAAHAGLLQPLEGKSPREKEMILQGLHDRGIPLPEGRTASEKDLIAKVKAREHASEKVRRAQAAGLLTPLEGKTRSEKEKIIRGLAMEGLPLPEAQTGSEKRIMEKVRYDLGLPPEPTTEAMKEKYDKAAVAGLLQPLEGKSPKEKERILQDLHDRGIPLPEGRTASERALIAKVKLGPSPPSVSPTERVRKAKAAGLMTPLEGKSPRQQEKILKGLAMQGLPLPEGRTASEAKLINKVRADLGLPPEPKTVSMRKRHEEAADAGLLQPLEGKSLKEKERILQGLHDRGIPLPEARTASEKAIIAKIKAARAPSEKLRRAKAAGLLTPLEGKSHSEKERIMRGLAMEGLPLPEAQTISDKKLGEKVRADLGLPPEPKTASMKEKYAKAADAGFLQPLEGKSPKEKERILQGLYDTGIPLPEGRTASERALIAKVRLGPTPPSVTPTERVRKAKAAGVMTPLEGKSPAQQEKILKGIAMQGLPLPLGKSASEKNLIAKVRADLGLPPEPKTASMREKYAQAADAGLLQPLEGKSPREKERILQGLHDRGIPLPEGRTASERALVAKVKAGERASEKVHRAQAAGLLTPLEGKTALQKEKILRGLAKEGLPLPEGKTSSEIKLIDKVRADVGLPPEPKTASMKIKYAKAFDAGLIQPLEGKSPREKERILQDLHDRGIPLPEGRTISEKALITKVKLGPTPPSVSPSERLRKAKAAGLITPLEGKSLAQQEKILKGIAMQGLPLPLGKSSSEKNLIAKVRADLGLPPEPKTASMREKYAQAADAGLLQPLEGKSPREKERILQGLHDRGIPLPEGRTASERALVAKVKAGERASEKVHRAQAAGLLTPLEGKTSSQKEKILRGLAKEGLPLPEGKTSSEKKLIEKVRADLGLPPEPKTASMKIKYAKAANAGFMQPLEGKTPKEKEQILQGLHDRDIPLPEGRTASERALIAKIKQGPIPPSVSPSERLRKAKAAGLITPLEGKSPGQQEKILKALAMQGLPLPEGKSSSEKNLIAKVRADLGLPPEPKTASMKEKYAQAADAGLLKPLEGKSPREKERILQGLHDRGIPLPEGRTASERALVAKVKAGERAPSVTPTKRLRKAKAAGLLTPLEGKSSLEKERIMRGLALEGLPLPEAQTASEKKLSEKVRADLGLPPEPKTVSMRDKYAKAAEAGLMKPLEGKTPREKERILQGLHDRGIPLPEGRTLSEKALIARIKSGPRALSVTPSERFRKAKAAGLLSPLEGKSRSHKERIMRGLAMEGLPLPEAETASEKRLAEKVRAELGLPPEPKTASMREKHARAADAGLLQPLEGKSRREKQRILQGLHDRGIPLPEGRTASEKSIIAEVKAGIRAPSEKVRRAEAAGLMSPLEGKSRLEKEKIMKGLAMEGLPLPEPKTPSQRRIMDKVRADLGLPPEPQTAAMRDKYARAADAGLMQPLEGKSPREKERILRGLRDRGIPLPQGRTASERALIAKVKTESRAPSVTRTQRLRKAKDAGFLTPLEGKSPEQQKQILRGLAMQGLPLPEGQTASERKLIRMIRADLGLPPEPKTLSMREKYAKAAEAGLLKPLEGKSVHEKERILEGLRDKGIPLPEGRTESEKNLIAKVKTGKGKAAALSITTAKLKKAKAAGLLTPLEGKTREEQEKILRGLAESGLPLPQGKTASEKALIKEIKAELGVRERTPSQKMRKAKKAGLLTPLEGKTHSDKEKILRGRVAAGLPLPEGRTASEKSLIKQIKADTGYQSPTLSERIKRAKDAGLLTPLEGKTASAKEKILRDRLAAGVPMPKTTTPSEKEIVKKFFAGEPPAERIIPSKVTAEKLQKAREAGLLTPLRGKSPEEKERILKGLLEQGLPLPESQTESERKIADKVRKEFGLPPEPETQSEKVRMHRAEAAGIVTPLEGKTSSEKERIVKGMLVGGIPLPEGRTASERAMIRKIKAEEGKLSPKVSGLLTPLEGKTPSQKERIIRGRAEAGIPLPEGKTHSDKALIQKIRTELGMPPPAKTFSEKEVIRKAKDDGLLTPIAGKSAREQERILRGLADAGLPLPEGKTASERAIIKKVRAEAGLPLEATPSEKRGEIKTKAKKTGISPSKRRMKAMAAGVSEQFEDIIKTTTCDRGCGCDKKKIRFKHSYVKIRVTSPDISSLCDCPNECLPGVKAGAFIDNEGIKVTVGRVNGVTSFTSQISNQSLETRKHNNIITIYDKILTDINSSNTSIDTVDTSFHNSFDTNDLKKDLFGACLQYPINVDKLDTEFETSCTFTGASYDSYTYEKLNNIDSDKSYYLLESSTYESSTYESSTYKSSTFESSTFESNYDESDRFIDSSKNKKSSGDIGRSSSNTLQECSVSYDSILIIRSESSVSLITDSSDRVDGTSVISFSNSSYYSSNSTQYLYYPVSIDSFSDSTLEESELFPNRIDYSRNDDSGEDPMISESENQEFVSHRKHQGNRDYVEGNDKTEMVEEHNTQKINIRKSNNGEPVVVISNLDSEHDISTMMDEILSKNEFSDTSSIFLVVPSSDDIDSEISSDCSTICIQLSKHQPSWNKKQRKIEEPEISTKRILSSTHGLKISSKGKQYCIEETVKSYQNKETMFQQKLPNIYAQKAEANDKRKNKLCQITTPNENIKLYHGVSTDTTSDRPCCCDLKLNKIYNHRTENECIANVVPDQVAPLLLNEGHNGDGYRYRLPKVNVIEQASLLTNKRGPTTVTPCVIPPCRGHPGCLPSDVEGPCRDTPILTPFCEPKYTPAKLPPELDRETKDEKQSEPCQCSPEKIKEMFELVLRRKEGNFKSTGCGGAEDKQGTSTKQLKSNLKYSNNKHAAPEQEYERSIKGDFNNYIDNSKGNDEDMCGQNYRIQHINEKVKCACSGKERTVNIGSLCPCEQYPPPVSMTTFGPKIGTRSMGCQCCCCDDSMIKAVPGSEKLDLASGVCQMEPGGTSCQAGRYSKTKKKSNSCACSSTGKNGKKNKNVICECPPWEPESKAGYLDEYDAQLEADLEAYVNHYHSYQWVDEKHILRQKSDMTQTQSGFTIKKKKVLPQPEQDFTIEDAVRYYVTFNPDFIKEFCPLPPDCPCDENEDRAKNNKKKDEVKCECPPGQSTSDVHRPVGAPVEPELEPKPDDEIPSGGIKFSIGGKGSGSKGLTGICCFDMIQETNISNTKHSKNSQ